MLVSCECNSFECNETVEVHFKDYLRWSDYGWVIISKNCPKGPEPSDVLVEEHGYYSLYQEEKE